LFSGPFGFPGIFFFLEIVGSALVIALVVGIVVFLVRPDTADVRGRRPYAVYLFVIVFASLLTLLGAVGVLAATLGVAITHTGGDRSQQCTFSATAEALPSLPEVQTPNTVTVSPFPIRPVPGPALSFQPSVSPLPRPFIPQPFPTQQEQCVSIGAAGQGAAAARAGIVAAVAAVLLVFHAVQARRLIAKEVSGA